MTTPISDWSVLVREFVRLAPSSRPSDGTAYDVVLDLLDAGYVISAKDGKLMVRPPASTEMPQDLRERITRNRDLILALMRPRPDPFTPGWEDEWRFELDSLLRKAACMLPNEMRDDVIALSRRTVSDESEWMSLAWDVMQLEHRLAKHQPTLLTEQTKTLTPWVGWVREDGSEWREVATHDDWDECYAATLRVPVTTHCERWVMPFGRHPDKRRRPR